MVRELTIEQARANAADFMYIFATKQFLDAIPTEYANIIRTKAANENYLLRLSAEKYGSTYEAYKEAVRQGFVETYDVNSPIEGLIILAQGGNLAGRNWSEGVYGVGTVSVVRKFKSGVTVDKTTGAMSENGAVLPTTNTVYADVKGKTVAYQIFAQASDGYTYMSQYSKLDGTYYAKAYTDAEGKKHDAYGTTIGGADAGTVWQSIIQSFEQFVEWLLSLFGVNPDNMLNKENTLPDQKTDGFVYKDSQAGLSEASAILLLLAAGGTLLAGGIGGRKKAK